MAIEAGLKQAIQRIGAAFDDYAAERDWDKDDFCVYVRYNENLGRIRIVFIAKGFEGEDRYERFEDVMNFLEEALGDDPELFHAINLIIWSRSEVNSGSLLTSLSNDDVPLQEFLVSGPVH